MEQQVEVAIIGAGSAGLYALGQVKRSTDSYVMVDGGELGTTCARVGCMPSKAMIQVAEDFHRRMIFSREGIEGGFELEINGADALEHVQDLRDIFVDKVLSSTTDHMGEEFIPEYARFLEPDLLAVGEIDGTRGQRLLPEIGEQRLEYWARWEVGEMPVEEMP